MQLPKTSVLGRISSKCPVIMVKSLLGCWPPSMNCHHLAPSVWTVDSWILGVHWGSCPEHCPDLEDQPSMQSGGKPNLAFSADSPLGDSSRSRRVLACAPVGCGFLAEVTTLTGGHGGNHLLSPVLVDLVGWKRMPCKVWEAVMGQDAQAMSSERIKQNQMLLSLMVTCPTHKSIFGEDKMISYSMLGEMGSLGGCDSGRVGGRVGRRGVEQMASDM